LHELTPKFATPTWPGPSVDFDGTPPRSYFCRAQTYLDLDNEETSNYIGSLHVAEQQAMMENCVFEMRLGQIRVELVTACTTLHNYELKLADMTETIQSLKTENMQLSDKMKSHEHHYTTHVQKLTNEHQAHIEQLNTEMLRNYELKLANVTGTIESLKTENMQLRSREHNYATHAQKLTNEHQTHIKQLNTEINHLTQSLQAPVHNSELADLQAKVQDDACLAHKSDETLTAWKTHAE
jgi:chromosome segregation ATPase